MQEQDRAGRVQKALRSLVHTRTEIPRLLIPWAPRCKVMGTACKITGPTCNVTGPMFKVTGLIEFHFRELQI